MIKKIIYFVISFFLVVSCSKKESANETITLSSNIIFFNIGHSSREEIGVSIDLIRKCSPKVIGIHAIFETPPASAGDSILVEAISRAGNVVLSFVINDNRILKSDSAFIKASHSQGLITYRKEEDKVVDFEMFTSFDNQLLWSFPAVVAGEFDFDLNKKLMEQTKANAGYEIEFYSEEERFNSLPKIEGEINCESIKDKIVLLGYLGPEEEDKFIVENKRGKVYSTVILANIITDILKEDFKESNR